MEALSQERGFGTKPELCLEPSPWLGCSVQKDLQPVTSPGAQIPTQLDRSWCQIFQSHDGRKDKNMVGPYVWGGDKPGTVN